MFDHTALPAGCSIEVSVQVVSAGRQSEPQPLCYHGDDPAPEGPPSTKGTPVLQFTSLSDTVHINQDLAATRKFQQLPSKFASPLQDEKEASACSSAHEMLGPITVDQLVGVTRYFGSPIPSCVDVSHGAALQAIKENKSSNALGTGLEKSSVPPLDASSISAQETATPNLSRDSFMVCEHPVSLVPCSLSESRTVILGEQETFAGVHCIKEDLQFTALYSSASCNTASLPQSVQSSIPCNSKDLDLCYSQLNKVVFDVSNNQDQVNQGFDAMQPSISESTSLSGALSGKHIKTTHVNNVAGHLGQVDNLASQDTSFMQPQNDLHHHETYADVKPELKFTNNCGINKSVLRVESPVKIEHAEDRTHEEFSTLLGDNYCSSEASIVESQLVTSPPEILKNSVSSSELNLGMCTFDSHSMLNSATTSLQEQYTLAAGTFINTNDAESSTYGSSSSLAPALSNTLQRNFVASPDSFKMNNTPNSLSNKNSSFSEALNNTSNVNGKNNYEQSTLDSSKNFTDLQKYLGPNSSSSENLGSSTASLNDIVMTDQAQPFPANANSLAVSAVMSYTNENLPSHAMSTANTYPTNQMSSQSSSFMNSFSTNNTVRSNTYAQNEEMGTPCFVSTGAEFINDSFTSSQQIQNKFSLTSQNHPISKDFSELGQSLRSVGQHTNLQGKSALQQSVFDDQTAISAMAIHHLSTTQMQVQPITNQVQMPTKINQVPSKIFGVCESMQQVHEELSHQCQVEAKVQYMPSKQPGQHTSLFPSDNLQHHTQSLQKVSFQVQHSQEGVSLVSQQSSVVAPCELKVHQNVSQSNCSTQAVPGLVATTDVQPDAVHSMQQLQHQVLPQIQQSTITSDSLALGVVTELQPQPAQFQQNCQSYDGLKSSVLVGDHDPLLSQVNTNLSSWSASAFDQTGANSPQNQINPVTVIPMQNSYIFMPNGNYQIENSNV